MKAFDRLSKAVWTRGSEPNDTQLSSGDQKSPGFVRHIQGMQVRSIFMKEARHLVVFFRSASMCCMYSKFLSQAVSAWKKWSDNVTSEMKEWKERATAGVKALVGASDCIGRARERAIAADQATATAVEV